MKFCRCIPRWIPVYAEKEKKLKKHKESKYKKFDLSTRPTSEYINFLNEFY